MGQIKVDPDRLEEFADKIGDAKSSCGDALSALKWHFSSLIAEVSDIEGGYASELYQQLINHIEHYQNLLDQSQAVVKRTAAEFRQADESWFGHLLDVGAEILPIHDFQRLFGEYDPVTGEKLGFGDRLLAFGMIASSIFPPARGAGLLVKTGIKGVKMIKMSEEGAKLVKGVKNVLNPDLIKNAFRNSYQAVKNQSLSLTNKIVKKAGDIRLPQVLQPEFAGIGKVETTVGDVVKSAKDTMMKAVGREGGESATARKVEESSSNISRPNDDIIRDGSHMDGNGRLKPNVKYQTGEYEYIYKTDELGRLNEFNADNLKLTVREERLPHKSNTPGKQPGDHAGHLAGDRFGGSPELDNLVSQSSKVNLSIYKKLENQWAKAISKGKEVSVKVKVHYDGSELRPSSFEVIYKIDGAVKKRVFRN